MKVSHSNRGASSKLHRRVRRNNNRLEALRRAVEEQAIRDYEEEQRKKNRRGSSKRTYYKQQKLSEIYERAEMMFHNNKSMEEIACAVNRNTRTIYYWKRKFNWKRDKQTGHLKGDIKYTKRPYRTGPKFHYRKQQLQKLYDIAQELFLQYKTYDEIGYVVKRSSRTIQNWKTKFGWERDKNEQYEVARRHYEEDGWWVKKIHLRLDIPVSTLYTWIRRDNWTQ